MEERTSLVLSALTAAHRELAELIEALRAGRVSVTRQHDLAARLIEAGDLLDEHADRQASAGNGHADGFGFRDSAE
ncbi:hypothetical protein [Saccharomonospora iraqiensis]|uniref:hypothetical protein n=1 Tax=Saccharomonospora iraqiensis TaxID=52698 RepID=UPI000478C14B|nr:hypothetical protein [Saccharomonospora iraqiensis]